MDDREPDAIVRERHGISSVDSLVLMRWLRYLPQLAKASPWLRAMLQCPGHPWVAQARLDVAALREAARPRLDELPDPAEDLDAYVRHVARYPGHWKAVVALLASPTSRRAEAQERTECPECGKLRKRQGLGAHMYRAHSVRRRARLFVDADGVCPACHRSFFTRLQCIHHMEYSSRACFAWCVGRDPLLAPDRVAELDVADAALRRRALRDGSSFLSALG